MMKIDSVEWTIAELVGNKDTINPKPQYQRTSVWNPVKKKLLLDSILRGYDLPKFYLRATNLDPMYEYEVTDGQQRMRAIWEFFDPINGYTLGDYEIEGVNLRGLKVAELQSQHPVLYENLNSFKLNIAFIQDASQEEIRTLFARLQMGEKLSAVELRHALASNLGNLIVSTVETNDFFSKECRIATGRYKHQEYLDNALTAAYYDCTKNVKAVEIRKMYTDFGSAELSAFQPMMRKALFVLNWLKEINQFKKGIFKNKWNFVDAFYLLYKYFDRIQSINSANFAQNLSIFESKRKLFSKDPERLIEDKGSLDYDKDMYDYILAFKNGGAESRNLRIRHRVYHNHFLKNDNINFKNLVE